MKKSSQTFAAFPGKNPHRASRRRPDRNGRRRFSTHKKIRDHAAHRRSADQRRGMRAIPHLRLPSHAGAGAALVNGVRLLLKGAGAKEAHICLRTTSRQQPRILQSFRPRKASGVMDADEHIVVTVLPTKYPQGGERQLIQAVLGREVPMGGLPADAGVIVSNVGTAKAAADMLLGQRPLTRRIVTVTGQGKKSRQLSGSHRNLCAGASFPGRRRYHGEKPHYRRRPHDRPFVWLPTGTEKAGFLRNQNTSGILVLPEAAYNEQPCIRCEGCASVCPAGLVPYQIEYALMEEDYDLCEKLFASECIACGCCSYICPAKRELTPRTRAARDIVKQRMRERAVKKS